MLNSSRLPVSTASREKSVWRDLGQDTFRKHIVDLQRVANEVPTDPIVHSYTEWQTSHADQNGQSRLLPFEVEQQVADDLAFVAAAEEGHKAISAVALQEQFEPCDALQSMFDVLKRCASRNLSREVCAQALFECVTEPNENRIHGRLESVHWKMPGSRHGVKGRRPVYEGVRRLLSDLAQSRSFGSADSSWLIEEAAQLSTALQKVESTVRNTDECRNALKDAIKHTHRLCTSGSAATLEQSVSSSYGLDSIQAGSHKTIQKLDKLGRYWGLCLSLAQFSRRHAGLFANIRLEPLRPYEGMTSKIAYVPGVRARCLVHAEMQLLVFYSITANAKIQKPRILGVSKSCCYLCNLFVAKHAQYFVTKTHGRLYERWNFPDLREFEVTEAERFRNILEEIDEKLQARFKIESRKPAKREHPMGSWLTLPPVRQSSPVPSTILSTVLDEGGNAITSKPGKSPLIQITKPTIASLSLSETSETSETTMGQEELPIVQEPTVAPNSGFTSPTNDKDSPPSSSGSTASWRPPAQRALTSTSPFRGRIGEAFVTIEIDDPAQGKATIARTRDTLQCNSGFAVDLHLLKSEEIRSCDRQDGEDNIILDLRHPNGQMTSIILEWL